MTSYTMFCPSYNFSTTLEMEKEYFNYFDPLAQQMQVSDSLLISSSFLLHLLSGG